MKSKKERETIIADCLELLHQEGQSVESILARYPEKAGEIRPDLEAAAWLLEKGQTLAPPAAFTANARQRLTRRIQANVPWQEQGLWQMTMRLTARPVLRLAVILLLVASILLNGYQAVKATRTSLPGDLVYPLKQAQETLELAFSLNAAGDASLHTHYAQVRLLEAQALVLEGRYEKIPGTVTSFEKHVTKALHAIKQVAAQDHNRATLLADDLQIALTSQSGLVTVLSSMAPAEARLQFERVRQVSEKGVADLESLLAPNSRQSAPQTGLRKESQGEEKIRNMAFLTVLLGAC
jgi:hypothetical protein